MKKILLLTEIIEGGEWIATKRLFEALIDDGGVVVDLVAWGDTPLSTMSKGWNDITLIHSSHYRGHFGFLKNLYADFVRARQILSRKTKSYDLIFTTNYLMMLVLKTLNQYSSVTKCYYFHGVKSRPIKTWKEVNYRVLLVKLLEVLAWAVSDTILVPSKIAASYITSQLKRWRFRIPQILIVPNIVNEIFFTNLRIDELNMYRKKWGIRSSNVILYVGRIDPMKGIKRLVSICEPVGFQVVIAYPSRNVCEDLLSWLKHKSGVSDIVLLPDLNEAELSTLYRLSSVLLLLSELEFAPLVIVEAMACGCICMGTPCGNIEEILSVIDLNLLITNTNSDSEIQTKLNRVLSLSNSNRHKLISKGFDISQNHRSSKVVGQFNHQLVNIV